MSIDLLAAKAARVAHMHRENRDARAELHAAHITLAESIVDVVRPALQALSSPISMLHRETNESIPVKGLRGVRIADPVPGLMVDPVDGWRIFGRGLYLSEAGDLAEAKLIGIPNSAVYAEWTAQTVPEVDAWFPAEDLVRVMMTALDEALDQQLAGKLGKRTTQLQETAADLRAIARLASRKGA